MPNTGYVDDVKVIAQPEYVAPQEYKSEYADLISSMLGKVINTEKFDYNPLQDASYKALAKLYTAQGNKAAQDTMGNATALNGGFGTSHAVAAAGQARNDFNIQLNAQIPALREAAYNEYLNNYQMNVTALDALRSADEIAYGRHRDTVADNQWQYNAAYSKYRDSVADSQWAQNYNRGVYESDRDYDYQKSRDKVADSQWDKEYKLDKWVAHHK